MPIKIYCKDHGYVCESQVEELASAVKDGSLEKQVIDEMNQHQKNKHDGEQFQVVVVNI